MKRTIVMAAVLGMASFAGWSPARADVVTDWNSTMCALLQHDGAHATHQANPGVSTRSLAMVNGGNYDAFQSINRTHVPFIYDTPAAANTSLDAAVHQAAYELLAYAYPNEAGSGDPTNFLDSTYASRIGSIANGPAKTNGMALGHAIAQRYMDARAGDRSGETAEYIPHVGPGYWRSDPFNLGQSAWGPLWGAVEPFAIGATGPFVSALPPPPALNTPAYTAAFNMVKEYGELGSTERNANQTAIGLFWAYDVPSMGPPPVLFMRNLTEIAAQAGNTPEENARMFAMASVAQADASIASWDAKFQDHHRRPVRGIQEAGEGGPGDADGNPDTIGVPQWKPLGAPGRNSLTDTDDFTPPFPSWTSGHATMGAAVFKSLELFYGTNNFDEIDGEIGNDPTYYLTSQEPGSGDMRFYNTFTQTAPLGLGTEDSPEGENAMSRVYLGVHWIFDQTDGTTLGRAIAEYVNDNRFQPIPEPSTALLAATAVLVGGLWVRREARRRADGERPA